MNSLKMSRRAAIGAGAVAVAAPLVVDSAVMGLGETPPSERLRIGLIGCGGMGRANLANCAKGADVDVVGLCDVWQGRLDETGKQYPKAEKYRDYRKLLERKDIDGVIIATPPHWHCRQAVDACEAEKDIYLQKPMTLHLGESLAVRNAVRRHKRISQVGTQIHASENYRRVVELVRSGQLGPIGCVRTFNVQNQGIEGLGRETAPAVPPDLDWELWIGPAPMRPYCTNLALSSFHHGSFFAYSGGWTPGMAPHIIDLPVWALDLGCPTMVACSGGRYIINDEGDVPDVQEILWQYPKLTMTWSQSLVNSYGFDLHGEPQPRRRLGIYFHGVNGTMYCNYGMFKVIPEGSRMDGMEPPKPSIAPSPGHERQWLDSIKSRTAPDCCVDYHVRVDIPLVLGNLSYVLGRSIRFDPATESIVGDDEAARRAIPEYRAPWKFPTEYLKPA